MGYRGKASIAIAVIGLLLTGCSGGGGGGGGAATPSPSRVLASRTNPGSESLDWLDPDATDVVVDTIAGGHLLQGGAFCGASNSCYIGSALISNGITGSLYGVKSGAVDVEIGIATKAGHVVYANQAGHDYRLLGFLRDRVLFEDRAATTYAVTSFAIAGGDARTLVTSCAYPAGGEVFFVDPRGNGAILECNPVIATYRVFYSDGLAPGTQLPQTVLVFGLAMNTTHVVLFDSVASNLVSQTFNMTAPSRICAVNNLTDTEVLLGTGATRLLVRAKDVANNFKLYTTDFDGTNCVGVSGNQPQTFTIDFKNGTAEDGQSFVVATATAPHALLVNAASGASNFDVSGGAAAIDETHFIAGNLVASRDPGGDWRITSRATTPNLVTHVGSGTMQFVGSVPGFIFLYDPGLKRLWEYRDDNVVAASNLLNNPADGHTDVASINHILLLPDGRIFWFEADGRTWTTVAANNIASADEHVIDTTPLANAPLRFAGTGSNPTRVFYVATRSATDTDTLVFDPATSTARVVAGAGAIARDGIFLP
jgi:hypothetical protein